MSALRSPVDHEAVNVSLEAGPPERSVVDERRPLRIFTWHVHGSYLLYLSHTRHELYLPVKADRPHGYGGRSGPFPWPANVHEVPVEEVPQQQFDCVLFQSAQHYQVDQFNVLSPEQRRLPRIYLEHDPPREHPTDTRHVVDDPDTLLVHVTPFNALMWDSGSTPTRVIEHGVALRKHVAYTGEYPCGIVVVNHLARRGRRLGADVFAQARSAVPLDLVGMAAEESGGIGEIAHDHLPDFMARYRFFFNPIRYTSLGLAVCEAMMIGLPIVGLATTEMATAVENGVSGYVDTSLERLIGHMRRLLVDHEEARALSEGAQHRARERFGIERFAREWDETFEHVVGSSATARVNRRSAGLGHP